MNAHPVDRFFAVRAAYDAAEADFYAASNRSEGAHAAWKLAEQDAGDFRALGYDPAPVATARQRFHDACEDVDVAYARLAKASEAKSAAFHAEEEEVAQ
jgi:hypothetical protein